jgi:hypothetical protein
MVLFIRDNSRNIGFDVAETKKMVFQMPIYVRKILMCTMLKRLRKNIHNPRCAALLRFMEQWTENTVHPVDIAYIIKRHPLMFTKVDSWNS